MNYLFVGLAVGFSCFLVAYGVEYAILMLQNQSPKFEIYVSGFSLTGNLLKQTGLITYLLCFLFNIINVVMEEGIFRGLFIRLGKERLLFTKANCFATFLFGLWHLSMPVKSFVDKEMDLSTSIIMGLGYIFLAFLMGIKWGLWFRNTNCLWFGIAEHFFNNTITNLLHLTISEGSDTLQFLRILIAQLLSLFITLFINNRYKKGLFKFE